MSIYGRGGCSAMVTGASLRWDAPGVRWTGLDGGLTDG